MEPLPVLIQHLGLFVGMLLCLMMFLGTVIMLLTNVYQRFTGWNETGYKQRLVDGLEEVIDEFRIGSEEGIICDYLRQAILEGEEIRDYRARDYVLQNTPSNVAELEVKQRQQSPLDKNQHAL